MSHSTTASSSTSRKHKGATSGQAPWKRDAPASSSRKKAMSPQTKAAAKRRAKAAGRPYPNLVDNMQAAKSAKASRSAGKGEKGVARKATSSKSSGASEASSTTKTSSKPKKDPSGGLTAAGRKAFAARDGAKLKPGVTKPMSSMTPDEMRRKGSWAVRFYGRDPLPPLVKANGEPTRFALSAHAWGEPVPRTEAQARRIADKGRRLLERYRLAKEKARATSAKGKRKASSSAR